MLGVSKKILLEKQFKLILFSSTTVKPVGDLVT